MLHVNSLRGMHRHGQLRALLIPMALATSLVPGLTSCTHPPAPSTPRTPPPPTLATTSTALPENAGQVVRLGDIDVYYEEHGAGEPLVLLHSGMGSSQDWALQIPAFSDQYRNVAPDSRGQGRTTDGGGPLTYQLMAEDTLRLLDYLGIESAFFVGFSDGGIVALELAVNSPERVRAAVASGANIRPDGLQPTITEFLRDSSSSQLEAAFAQPYMQLSPHPERLPQTVERMRTLWLTEPNFTSEELARIPILVLIIDGHIPDAIRPGHAEEIAAMIPGAELLLLPGVGHNAPRDASPEWNRAVLDFLGRQ